MTHIPNKGEQRVRYVGFYSNKSRAMRKKADIEDQVPTFVESAVSSPVTGYPIDPPTLGTYGD